MPFGGLLTVGLLGAAGGVYASNKASGAARDAAQTQAQSADQAAQQQNAMFQQSQQYLDPYRRGGYTAAPLLEYLATGNMPQFSEQEADELQDLQGWQAGEGLNLGQQAHFDSLKDASRGGALGDRQRASLDQLLNRKSGTLDTSTQTRLDQLMGRQNAMQVAQGGMQGMIESSPMYQYQRDIGEKNMNRMLSARGRGNSTFGINALGEQNRALVAGESQNMYNRIAGLADRGQGIATQSGQNAMVTGQNVGNLMQQSGNAIAQGQQQAGAQQASIYSNLGAMPAQMWGQYQMANAMKGR